MKRTLSTDEIESQTILELPSRDLLGLVTVIITDTLNGNTITLDVRNVAIGLQVCAQVELIDARFFGGTRLECEVQTVGLP